MVVLDRSCMQPLYMYISAKVHTAQSPCSGWSGYPRVRVVQDAADKDAQRDAVA